ncbi:hypothetical protein XM38_042550 [Halomicronema hongdechloris C2206]|uniref:Uncharacterized protein n=1 Tax=Halomicronema hongdechloris C2206 TaxID=1641165 RepID=A0A1Z3HSJ9_9CYAN|nr:hypothetical protein XM38_042550 [Halomicronema hongdechloris C2206]
MEREDLWKEFDKNIDLYKFYLEIVLKTSIFIFGITGAIVSYYFSNASKPLVELSLCLPLIMNAGFAYLCFKGASFADILDRDHDILSEELGTRIAFTFSPLHEVLRLFVVLYALVSISLGVILVTDIV